MPNRVQKFFTLVGLLKYGIVLSLLLIYLPLTAIFETLPGHDITGNMFVELPTVGVLIVTMFLLAVAWSIMLTEGFIVNGSENRFDKSKSTYRSLRQLQNQPAAYISAWADFFFSIPVTGWQFIWFTILLASPSVGIIVWHADHPILALFAATAAFVICYIIFILVCTPAALLDPGDPPLHGLPFAQRIWSRFGYRGSGVAPTHTLAYTFSLWLREVISSSLIKVRLHCLMDPQTNLVYPMDFLAIITGIALLGFWIIFDWLAYPGGPFDFKSAPVVYVYASLLLFVWLFEHSIFIWDAFICRRSPRF